MLLESFSENQSPNSSSNACSLIGMSGQLSSFSVSDELSPSCTKSHSLPCIALLAQLFLKDRMIISDVMSAQTSFTHWKIVSISIFSNFRSLFSVDIHSINLLLYLSLNGLFIQTLNGCSIPRGTTATDVFISRHSFLTLSVKYAWKEFHT